MRLQSLKILGLDSRNSAIDVMRAVAILGVVIFHFNNSLPYGYLGVDLFFVISGFLVSGLLTRKFIDNERINFWQFFVQRGFKILPSYFAFLLIGNVLAFYLYRHSDPSQLMETSEWTKYIFFYKNFSMAPLHSTFDQAWSLCVEEHFYLALPITFIILQVSGAGKKQLFLLTSMAIVAGIIFKNLSFFFSHSGDTAFKTYNRMDGLAWGMLLNLVITYYPDFLKRIRKPLYVFFSGLCLFAVMILVDVKLDSVFFHKVVLLSAAPFLFFLMLLGIFSYNFSRLLPLRFIAYYSYNWYLWHAVVGLAIMRYFGTGLVGFAIYILITFSIAILFTIVIEEPFLKLRKKLFRPFSRTTTPEMQIDLSAPAKTLSN
ncbi:MAG: acyltransferase [Chitinophagaceae bacterium]|nr:acyltransferase [Chitinophagaceae bacterium]